MYSVNGAATATTLSQGFYFVAFDMFDPSCSCSCNTPKRIWWVTLHDVYTIPESSMYIPNVTWIPSRLVKGAWNIGDLFCANEPIVDVQPYMYKCCWVYIYICRPPLSGWWPSPTEKNGCLDPSAAEIRTLGFAWSAPAIAAAHPRPSPWLRSQLEKLRKWHTIEYSKKLKSLTDLSEKTIVLRGVYCLFTINNSGP